MIDMKKIELAKKSNTCALYFHLTLKFDQV